MSNLNLVCEICGQPAIYDNRWVCSIECQDKFLEKQYEFDMYDAAGLIDLYGTVEDIPHETKEMIKKKFLKKTGI